MRVGGLRAIREALWLTRERITAHSRTVAIVGVLAFLSLLLTATGGVDIYGRPIGVDFSSFYAAGKLAGAGRAASAYDWSALHAAQQEDFGEHTPLFIWSYPPFALLPFSFLARLPYGWALALYLGLTFAAYWVVVRRLAPAGAEAFWAIAGFPAVFVNVVHGQNGFLSTALLGAGLILLPRRPVLAGLAMGLLAYKPQLAILIPFALASGGHWRTTAAAAATVAASVALGMVAYGSAPYQAFLEGLLASRQAILEDGATGFHKLQSVLAAVRLVGGDAILAWTVQGVASAAALVVVVRVWRSRASHHVKGATLVTASLLGTPFLNVYDLVLLALPIALVLASGSPRVSDPWERVTLLSVWSLPLVSVLAAAALGLPLTPILLLALLLTCLRRGSHEQETTAVDESA